MRLALRVTHASQQPAAYACLYITTIAAVLAVSARLLARRLTRVSLWYDDYFALLGFFFALVWAAYVLYWLHEGLGLFLSDIRASVDHVLEVSRFTLWELELMYAFSLAMSKLSILALYWRLFRTSSIKLPIQVLAGCTVIWLILRTFLAIFHCIPIEKFWKPSLPGTCAIDDSKFFVGTVITHSAIDIAILVLPVVQVRKLKLPLSQRVAIMAMFGFGIFVCGASIMLVAVSRNFDGKSDEMPWGVTPIIVWATAEVNLAVVSACLPILRPVYLFILRRPVRSSSSASCVHSCPLTATRVPHTSNPACDKDSDSMLELATRGGSMGIMHGNSTVVVGKAEEEEGRRSGSTTGQGPSVPTHARMGSLGGILVTSETVVRVDRVSKVGSWESKMR